MIVTRVGYALIIFVVASAAVAIAIVLRPDEASHPPALDFEQVINYSKYGVIESIDEKGSTLTVRFKQDFDTQGQFGTDVHTFESSVPAGQDLVEALSGAGIAVNAEGGLQVNQR